MPLYYSKLATTPPPSPSSPLGMATMLYTDDEAGRMAIGIEESLTVVVQCVYRYTYSSSSLSVIVAYADGDRDLLALPGWTPWRRITVAMEIL